MKHDVLRSVAHNISDSLACGSGFSIGVYFTDIYAEARRSPGGFITVDFLHGAIIEGNPSPSLSKAVELYRDALPSLCDRQGVSVSDFAELTARYSATPVELRFVISVTGRDGRQSFTEYGGFDSQRVKAIDMKGRLRPKPVRRA